MPVSPETLKILTGGIWASNPGALKQDPSAADPAVTRADGYPAAYSSTLNPEQETIQGRWNEFDSAVTDIFTEGVPIYDDEIDYPVNAITNQTGVLYRALVANGPSSTVVTPGTDPTVWARVSGTQGAPSAPDTPTAVAGNGTLDISWNCPLDGGVAITEFELQYRNAGSSWPGTSVTTTAPFRQLTGLMNGQAVEFRVRATNSIGDSPWSSTGTGTPTATIPGGGSTLALRATAGDTEATLEWLEPDDGGASITSYEVQWRSSSQAFSSSRQASVTTESYTRTGLGNGTEYTFRVRARNSAGPGTWSNEATATPVLNTAQSPGAGQLAFSGGQTYWVPLLLTSDRPKVRLATTNGLGTSQLRVYRNGDHGDTARILHDGSTMNNPATQTTGDLGYDSVVLVRVVFAGFNSLTSEFEVSAVA